MFVVPFQNNVDTVRRDASSDDSAQKLVLQHLVPDFVDLNDYFNEDIIFRYVNPNLRAVTFATFTGLAVFLEADVSFVGSFNRSLNSFLLPANTPRGLSPA